MSAHASETSTRMHRPCLPDCSHGNPESEGGALTLTRPKLQCASMRPDHGSGNRQPHPRPLHPVTLPLPAIELVEYQRPVSIVNSRTGIDHAHQQAVVRKASLKSNLRARGRVLGGILDQMPQNSTN